ncbi:MAG: Flp pilus assembly protein CpaB [Candidatus Accumulibacter sp.]|nr:Flp pilus assembly protein CpaB [Accumulibacter sp.]
MSAGKRRLALLGVAVAMAGLAGFLVKFYLDRKAAELESRYADNTEKVRIVVPKRDIPSDTRVVIEDFAIRAVPTDLVPPDAIRPEDIDNALGQSLKIGLPLGRPLLWGYLSSGRNSSFSDLLDKERRALTISVDELNSISGMVRPSDRIDLFIVGRDSLNTGGGKEARIVRPLLQDVLVKATGNIVRRETGQDGKEYDRRYSTLTLDLLPDEIGRVLIAQENGELKAALKRPEQHDAHYRPTRESDLWAEDGGEVGGIVFYAGGKGGALKPEVLPFVRETVVAANGTAETALPGEDTARGAPPREARGEPRADEPQANGQKTDGPGAVVPAPTVAASRTANQTTHMNSERAQ